MILFTGLAGVSACRPAVNPPEEQAPMTLSRLPQSGEDPDTSWADPFSLPGCVQRLEGTELVVAYPRPLVQADMTATPYGQSAMRDLAGLVLRSPVPLHVEVVASGIGADDAGSRVALGAGRALALASLLAGFGLDDAAVSVRGSELDPDDLNRSQVVRVRIRRAAPTGTPAPALP